MNTQLHEFTTLLDDNDVPYWLDSGTLLALIRDGDLFEDEKDLDISIGVSDQDALEAVIPEIESLGYRTLRRNFFGKTFSYGFKSTYKQRGELAVDVKVFRRSNMSLWSYAFGPKKPPSSRVMKMLSQAYNRLYLTNERRYPGWPVSQHDHKYWVYPAGLLSDFTMDDEFGYLIPEHYDKYLTYRYDDWRTPVKEWNVHEMDGGIYADPPDSIVADPRVR